MRHRVGQMDALRASFALQTLVPHADHPFVDGADTDCQHLCNPPYFSVWMNRQVRLHPLSVVHLLLALVGFLLTVTRCGGFLTVLILCSPWRCGNACGVFSSSETVTCASAVLSEPINLGVKARRSVALWELRYCHLAYPES